MDLFNQILAGTDELTKEWIIFGLLLFGLVLFALILHKVLIKNFLRFASWTDHTWDDEIAEYTNRPIQLFLVALSAVTAVEFSSLPLKESQWISVALQGLAIISLFWSIERVVYILIRAGILLRKVSQSSRLLISLVVRATILAIAFMMVLDAAGISITPLLASLGVGSVAVALALQDTLSNLFSGFYILADKPFEVGQFVEVDGAIQGYVVKVGWRSTHIKQITNNVIIVPNSKVADSTIINYDHTQSQTSMLIGCGVAYESDLDQVEKICVEVAKKLVTEKQEGVPEYEPLVRFNEFGDSSINFNVVIRVNKFTNHYLLKHEYIKALHKAFNDNNIEIPFPQRVMSFKTPLDVQK